MNRTPAPIARPRRRITELAPALREDRRLTEVGRIRLGDKSDKGAPRRLTKLRFTSPHADLLQRVADVYGGTVEAWDAAPTGRGTQHQVYVEAEVVDVLVPPGQILSQAYEMWSGGGCTRRCDGVEQDSGDPCACPIDPTERAELAGKGKACKLTTRVSLWLPKVPSLGLWRLESHGYYAGMEIPGMVELLSGASERMQPIPATLRISSRKVLRNGETKQFTVPQIDPSVSVGQVMAMARGEHAEPAVIEATARPALEAAPVEMNATHPDPLVAEAAHIIEVVGGADAERKAYAKELAKAAGADRFTVKALAASPVVVEQVRAWIREGMPIEPAEKAGAEPQIEGEIVDANAYSSDPF